MFYNKLNNLMLDYQRSSENDRKIIKRKIIRLIFNTIDDRHRNKIASNFDRRLKIELKHNPFSGYSRFKN